MPKNNVHLRNKWQKKCESCYKIINSIWINVKKASHFKIILAQILYFGSQLWKKKVKILLVCSEIIAYLNSQLERKKDAPFKIFNEKFVDYYSAVKSCILSMNYKNYMHFEIQVWENKISAKRKIIFLIG